MARTSRLTAPGYPHYAFQESRLGASLFPGREDFESYLAELAASAERNKVRVLAYCLLETGVHLLLQPKTAEGLGTAIRRAHSIHGRRLAAAGEGPAWRDRYASCPVERSLAPAVAHLIERLPAEVGLVRQPARWKWSSGAERAGTAKARGLAGDFPGAARVRDYAAFLRKPVDEAFAAELEAAARRGRPFGSPAFAARIAARAAA